MNQERRVMEPNAEGYQEEWQWCAHKSITTSSLENKIEESWFLVYAFFCDVDCTIVPASYWENITKHRAGKRCAQSAITSRFQPAPAYHCKSVVWESSGNGDGKQEDTGSSSWLSATRPMGEWKDPHLGRLDEKLRPMGGEEKPVFHKSKKLKTLREEFKDIGDFADHRAWIPEGSMEGFSR